MSKISVRVNLSPIACCTCGTVFGITEQQHEELKETGALFYCPNGHGQFFNEPMVEKLRRVEKELKQEQEAAEYWRKSYNAEESDHKTTKNNLRGARSALTKTKNRIKNGICPCCKRHFENLQRHMTSEHPDYPAEKQMEVIKPKIERTPEEIQARIDDNYFDEEYQ